MPGSSFVESTAPGVRVVLASPGIEAMDRWLAMLRKALEKNYDQLDGVLAGMEKHKKGEKS